ncbi:MAG: MBL fold metallo-hydrolase [Actinomycetota bacterium]|nr:MBL fold metallo-hydrolase [Actinomycetota bacterium]
MRITLLGTGGPRPDPERQGPATLVEVAGLRLLFDAGRGVATQLIRAGVETQDLDAVFLTHHHFDHIGGLGDLLMAAWNNGRAEPLNVYGPRGTRSVVDSLFTRIYASDIQFRIREAERLNTPIPHPADVFRSFDIETGVIEPNPQIRVEVGSVEHGSHALELGANEWSAVGYRIEGDDRAVAVAGDAVAGRDLGRLALDADALVICAYLAGDEIVGDEDRFLAEHILAGAPQAAQIAIDTGARQLILTHMRQKPVDSLEAMAHEVRRVYDGELVMGEDLLTIEV